MKSAEKTSSSARLPHSGRRKNAAPKTVYHSYSKEQYISLSDITEIPDFPETDNLWIHCYNGITPELCSRFGQRFKFNKLMVEDAAVTPQPPKLDEYDDSCFLTLSLLEWNVAASQIEEHQISFLWKKNLLISMTESEKDEFEFLSARLSDPSSNVRSFGIDYLLFSLLNFLIDNSYKTAKSMLDYYDDLEERLFFSDFDDISTLHSYRRQVTLLSRSLMPLLNIFNKISLPEFSLATPKMKRLFANLNNNVTQVINLSEKLRDSFSFLIDSVNSKNAQSVNKVMKVLTIVSTIFMPLSFIAGVYGMNFAMMPELGWRYGYPAVLLLMAAVTGGMIFYFKKKNWW